MRLSTFLLLLLLIGALVVAGYFYQQNRYATEKAQILEDWNSELKFQFERLQVENAALSAQLQEEIAKVSEAKELEIQRLTEAHDKLIEELKSEISQQEVQITQLADRLFVRMTDQILFPSGEAGLTDDGLKVLQRVGDIIRDVKDKTIRVEGHTDNVPIHPRLQKQFPTNWELAAARATNVVRFLQDRVGIPGEKLEAVGRSEYHPVASNKTKAGRSKNRRIEIVLISPFPMKDVSAAF